MSASLSKRLAAELLGTALLLATVVGSGIMAERLSGGNIALALLANALATGGGLIALIVTFGPISGAHFNPVVSLAAAINGDLKWADLGPFLLAQFMGGILGVFCAHMMFDLAPFTFSQHARSGPSQAFSEFVATFGLLAVIGSGARHNPSHVPYAVAGYIVAAYWFTASTSFANPAVTAARALTDTFAGIRPADVPVFILAQLAGALAATFTLRWLCSPAPTQTADSR